MSTPTQKPLHLQKAYPHLFPSGHHSSPMITSAMYQRERSSHEMTKVALDQERQALTQEREMRMTIINGFLASQESSSRVQESARCAQESAHRAYLTANSELSSEREAHHKTRMENVEAIGQRDKAFVERDKVLAERDKAIAERDQALAERNVARTQRDQALQQLQSLLEHRVKVCFIPSPPYCFPLRPLSHFLPLPAPLICTYTYPASHPSIP
ncbi:hypothetical protein B0H19DRAFT_1174751 [Mycena capillaripes]|nr:hypothetical protein B0H19DRAFT_1174751 [Mycena capillaripes]